MRNIPKELHPVRSYYSAMFFSALRDSFQPPSDPNGDGRSQSTMYYRRRRDKLVAEAREYIREKSMMFTPSTDGFGHVYEILRWIGSVYIDIDTFVAEMEKLWEKIDNDPSLGRHMIDGLMVQALKFGIEELEPFDEYAEFSPHGAQKAKREAAA